MDIRAEGAHAVLYRVSMVSCPSTIHTEQLMRRRLNVFTPKIREINQSVS